MVLSEIKDIKSFGEWLHFNALTQTAELNRTIEILTELETSLGECVLYFDELHEDEKVHVLNLYAKEKFEVDSLSNYILNLNFEDKGTVGCAASDGLKSNIKKSSERTYERCL